MREAPPLLIMDRQTLRRELISRRDALSPRRQREHAAAVATSVWRIPALARGRNIALYHAVGGELDSAAIIGEAWSRGRRVFMPVLDNGTLKFGRTTPATPLVSNRYGIPEPAVRRRDLCNPASLDIVLCPLVGFDVYGQRLGMGGGYYDRTFAFLLQRRRWRRPCLIGLAHDCQKVPKLKGCTWDVPLDYVVTEAECYQCKG